MTWHELLAALADAPRENGTPAVDQAAQWLAEMLKRTGADVQLIPYLAHFYRLRIAGLVALVGCLVWAWLVFRRHYGMATIVALAFSAALIAELDYFKPVFGWIGARTQYHVQASIKPKSPEQALVFTAHFDSKTDVLDHVERAAIDFLSLPVTLFLVAVPMMLARGHRRESTFLRLRRVALLVAPVYGAPVAVVLTGGVFVPSRSHGALDNGAACAVLVRLAEHLQAQQPARTQVDVLLLSGEEIGVQGSWEYASRRFASPPALPTRVVNLEFIGATRDLAVLKGERFTLRSYPASPEVVTLLDRVHHGLRGKPIHITWYSAGTDARSFLARGIPAATLFSDLPGHALARHMHTSWDRRERVDKDALEATLEFLVQLVRVADAG